MPIHTQKASRYYGPQFLRSQGFKTTLVVNDLSLHKTGNYFMAIRDPEKKFMQEAAGIRRGREYPVTWLCTDHFCIIFGS